MVVTSAPLPIGAVGMAPAGTGTAGGMRKIEDGFVPDDEDFVAPVPAPWLLAPAL